MTDGKKLAISPMEAVEYFSDFLKKIGVSNFLAIGIVIIVAWLIFSGLRKGLRKEKHDDQDENGDG